MTTTPTGVICGVMGDYTEALLGGLLVLSRTPYGACPTEATETVRFRCAEGHERSRVVCAAHADVLLRPRGDDASFCRVCYEATGREVPLTPIGPPPARPLADAWWRCPDPKGDDNG